jgi:hypothetical protein
MVAVPLFAATLAILLASIPAPSQTIRSLRIETDPKEARVRPLESIVLQVKVYGDVVEGGTRRSGRLRVAGALVEVVEPGGGWISKPFKYQGTDTEPFVEESDSAVGRIFKAVVGDFVLQDAVLYTAPEKPGKYTVRALLEGVNAEATITVDPTAPPRRKPEAYAFPTEGSSRHPYRPLAEHYAPFIAQETWFEPKADYLARFDYDGDWQGDNNWDNLESGSSQAYVYFAVMETKSHWFIIYNLFHPRDYSDKCVAGSCHENDNEGLILTVAKDGTEFGRLQVMETLAHNNVYTYVADDRIAGGIHDIDGVVELHEGRPVVFVESGGHGIYGSASKPDRFQLGQMAFPGGTGVTYTYKGRAERPRHPNDRNVGYELLSIYDHWWTKANRNAGWKERTFDQFFVYRPFGGRPGVPFDAIGRSFLGRKHASNSAKPFWGWHDTLTLRRKVLNVGQWGLDPAYAISVGLRMPNPNLFSTDYVFNPYLGIGEMPSSPITTATPVQTADQAAPALTQRSVSESAASPAADQLLTPEPDAAEGEGVLTLLVDERLDIVLSGQEARFDVLAGAPVQDASLVLSHPLPEFGPLEVKIEKLGGPGSVSIVEQPSDANHNSVRIRVEDPAPGVNRYTIRIEWKRR